MAYDDQNVFARILRGELPCFRLFEDADTLAFMDIMPQSDGHALVIPKEAATNLLDVSPQRLGACILLTQRIAQAAQRALGCEGILVVQTNGAAAGQTVPHLHFHVIPRYEAAPLAFHASRPGDPVQIEALAERIRAHL